ncbi:unnamed protein product [Paramecium primaurelia]|uniref:Uncharacterized protein n=1 Tax=Paramecium primaurelia TaxID=5886 RepID=A0A8S1LXA6_PARPR|nr:unnamed protein product [Paramecium primaurelia]
MKAQDNSFRLPALKLQPREYKFNLSQESIEQNQSKETIQQNGFNHYNPSPIRHRNKIMSVSVYNSQEKIKPTNQTKHFQNSEFITCQNTNNSISVVQTVRRYRSKLKKLVQHNQNRSEINSRDPRYFFFKEPSASIKLNNLQDNTKQVDKLLEERIKQLMTKVQMLISSQSFYQQKKYQVHLNVNLVKLQDEYDVLFQDFNEFYFSSKRIDSQIKNLLNHMQIIKKLLSPLQKPYGMCQKSSQSLHQNIYDSIQEETKESATQRIDNSQIQGRVDIDNFDEQSEDDDFNQDDINSYDENDNNQDGQPFKNNRQSSNKKMKNTKSRSKIKQQGTMDSDQTKESQDQESIKFDDQGNQIISPNKRRRKISQISNNANNIENQQEDLQDGDNQDFSENGSKQKNQLGKIASRRRTVIKADGSYQSDDEQHSGNDNEMVIQEEELSENEQESEVRNLKNKDKDKEYNTQKQVQFQHSFNKEILIQNQEDDFQDNEGPQSFRQERFLIQHPNHEIISVSLLDRFLHLDNIYDYKFLQSWNYHIAQIRQAKFLDEFDI